MRDTLQQHLDAAREHARRAAFAAAFAPHTTSVGSLQNVLGEARDAFARGMDAIDAAIAAVKNGENDGT